MDNLLNYSVKKDEANDGKKKIKIFPVNFQLY